MLLAIDVGNTNVKVAVIEDGEIRLRWRIATDARRTADEYAVWLLQLMAIEGVDRADIDDVIMSSVVPRAVHNITVLADKYFGRALLVAGQGDYLWPIQLDVAEPKSVGADRAVNAIAAHAQHQGDIIMISFGTATTVDHVDYGGAYKGGLIAPGLNLSLDALVAAAAKLPRVAIEVPQDRSVIGRTTESQMLMGVYWGYVAMIEGLIARMKAEIGRPTKIIATGGLATVFQEQGHLFDTVDPDLTLKGLALLYQIGRGASTL
jgi:type III pantothenate kinase